jgi:hypothetical protein
LASAQEATPTPVPPLDPPLVVPRPDASTCSQVRWQPTDSIRVFGYSDCANGVPMMEEAITTTDGQHLLGLSENWYLPGHYYTVGCTYPVDPYGPPVPTGPPTCTDAG